MTVHIALVGCGAIAESLHLPAAERASEISIVALVDSDIGRAQRLAEQFRIPAFHSDLSECEGIDAVLLATPPHVRTTIVRQALEMGLDVLIEKPLANSMAECEEMVAMSDQSEQILAVAHVYRFWPTRRRIREAIQTEEFGQVREVHISQGKPYSWQSVTGYTMQRALVPGGVLINAGTHPLDSLLWWLGDPISIDYRDDSLGGLESNFSLTMSFPSGAVATLLQSRTSTLKHEIAIRTSEAEIELPTYSRDQFTVRHGESTQDIICTDDADHLLPGIVQLQDFARAVRERSQPCVSTAEAARVIHVIEECYAQKRQRPLPEKAPISGMVW